MNTLEYNSWAGLKHRCLNKSHKDYKNYGAKGIKVCDRWVNSFENFLSDMGYRPSPSHSIDRIDNNGDYTPENCRWATKTEQVINRNPYNKLGISGVSFHKRDRVFQSYITVNSRLIHLGSSNNLFDAACLRKSAENSHWGH